MITKGENGKWWDAARGVTLDSLDELLGDDGYGRIVPIMEIDRERGKVETVGVEWVGPEPAYVSATMLYGMGIEAYSLRDKDSLWIGQFNVAILSIDAPFRDALVYRLNGGLSQRVNIILWRIKRLATLTDERLRWTARIWGLIPGRTTAPEWKDLRPYAWLGDKWNLFLAPGSPPKELPKLPTDRGEWGRG